MTVTSTTSQVQGAVRLIGVNKGLGSRVLGKGVADFGANGFRVWGGGAGVPGSGLRAAPGPPGYRGVWSVGL